MSRQKSKVTFFSSVLNSVIRAVEAGYDINLNRCESDSKTQCFTPLGFALYKDHVNIFKYLIRRGADIDKNIYGDGANKISTALWYAAQWKKYEFLEPLLKHGAEKTLNAEGYSLLTYAISECDLKLFNYLIENGDDVNQVDGRGESPLLTAVREGRVEIVKTLLDYGAEFSLQSALIEAVTLEELEITELLTERGAKVNFQSVTGFTPLTKATKIGNFQISKVLIEKGADVNLSDLEGNFPLLNSVGRGQLDLVQLLVENGANVQQADSHGNLPITKALNTQDFPVIRFLIENGADWKNLRDKDGCPPLILSVRKRNFDMLKFFLDRKVDVNEADNNQKTALLLAVETGNLRFAKMLTEHGAVVDDVVEKIEQFASTDDNWKNFLLELKAERKILEHSET